MSFWATNSKNKAGTWAWDNSWTLPLLDGTSKVWGAVTNQWKLLEPHSDWLFLGLAVLLLLSRLVEWRESWLEGKAIENLNLRASAARSNKRLRARED